VSSSLLHGRRIALGVSGGIAAYKAADLVRALRKEGAEVRVAMTAGAGQFVTPLLMQSLSGNPVLTDLFDPGQEALFGHLALSRWAEVFVVAPATADLLARMRAGLGNDALTTALLAFRGPVVLAPAMNTAMWEHEATRQSLAQLLAWPRHSVVGPAVGPLADGDVGAGRLAELPDLVAAVRSALGGGALAGQRVLVTAGPTREALDPVRFLSNPSTGKMGLEVAAAARRLGAKVTVVLGPTSEPSPAGVEVVGVTTADEMLAAVLARLDGLEVLVAAAAVSDWRPREVSERKEKKSEGPLAVTLVRTPDVLLTASQKVWAAPRRPLLVGFAAETHEVLESARAKLERKRLDFIVANDVAARGSGFAVDTNAVTVLSHSGQQTHLQGSKAEVAARLWEVVLAGGRRG
jgi:phosphopantothenoylcysteine decarboxylase / phosphopantothenate---cysteine ligase